MEKIKFDNVTFRYPSNADAAIDNISFSVESSEFIVVCGRSGCGKSTLLRNIKKTLRPYGERKGNVFYDGIDIEELDELRSACEIGFVQQNPDSQIVTDKVWRELAFGLENMGEEPDKIRRRVAEMSEYFGIQKWFHREVNTLSGGQKQILNLASVMAMNPQLLVLDEPLSQLDPIAATDFLNTVIKLNRELGITVIMSEHRLEDVIPCSDRVMVMDKGEITVFDVPERIGSLLAENKKEEKDPMFYAMPTVVRIFSQFCKDGERSPLTVRDGRLRLQSMIDEKKVTLKEHRKICTDVKKKDKQEKDAIYIKNLWFRYEKTDKDIFQNLSLNIQKGEWHCLLGGNGSGKSTLLKAICGIVKPQRGNITVEGINVSKKNDENRLFDQCLAMLPQDPKSLFTEITVEDELYEALHMRNLKDTAKIEETEKMMEMMQIADFRKMNPYDLSGGQQQRLALGKILLLKPSVLLMDEPTKGIDQFFKIELARILKKLKNNGVTIFMVTHDMEFCSVYADRCSMLFDGRIVSQGKTKDFFAGNSFYTTAANRLVRKWRPDLVTCEEAERWIIDELL